MKLGNGLITAALWSAVSAAIAAGPYVGTRIPPLPVGCKEAGNGILPNESTHAVRSVKCSGVRMEWLLARASAGGSGGYWDVKDVIVYPKAPEDFEPTRLDCSFDGAKDETIIAVVTKWRAVKGGGEAAVAITHAWRPDLKNGKFQVLPVERVSCAYAESRI